MGTDIGALIMGKIVWGISRRIVEVFEAMAMLILLPFILVVLWWCDPDDHPTMDDDDNTAARVG